MRLGRYLLAFLVILGYMILFGKSGIVDNCRMEKKLAALRQANSETVREIDGLKSEILLLRTDPKSIERLARKDLGMVRRGDLVYRFAEASPPPREADAGGSDPPNTDLQPGL